MIKPRKKRRSRTSGAFFDFIVDEDEKVYYIKNGKRYRRRYIILMHRNNNVGRYWAGFGYYVGEHVKYLWMKTADQFGFSRVKDELWHRYHNHVEIMLDQLKLVKVKKSIIKEGGLPGMPNGKGLPVEEGYDVFKIVGKVKGEFNLLIEGIDGRVFKVSSDCFVRTKPMNWIEERYLE